MPDTVIKVDNLSKQYRLGAREAGYRTFRETIMDAAKAPFLHVQEAWGRAHRAWSKTGDTHRSAVGGHRSSVDDFIWALKNVSFEVKRGEVVGIIGRNGAGKSTLLKILSKITEPTEGRVELRGRVGSLLEVGTGFHPELTGHENVYLYGAILGMDRWEITRKFDEIIAFAEMERFIDTPVKRYSSGMYMRLAFAVAAHLEPEILLVDEVLAVGDAAFQKKCLGKMNEVGMEGRTVLVISHQMTMIRNLCRRCLLLTEGQITHDGRSDAVIPHYLQTVVTGSTEWKGNNDELSRKGLPYFTLDRFALADQDNRAMSSRLDRTLEAFVVVEGTIHKPTPLLCIGFNLFDNQGNNIMLSFQTDQPHLSWPRMNGGAFRIRARFDLSMLNEGSYRMDFLSGIHCEKMLHIDEVSIGFEILGNLSGSPYWINKRDTILAPALKWESY